jgi:hypothetical protein
MLFYSRYKRPQRIYRPELLLHLIFASDETEYKYTDIRVHIFFSPDRWRIYSRLA